MTGKELKALKRMYKAAVHKDKSIFFAKINGEKTELLTAYAKYLIEYWDQKLKNNK